MPIQALAKNYTIEQAKATIVPLLTEGITQALEGSGVTALAHKVYFNNLKSYSIVYIPFIFRHLFLLLLFDFDVSFIYSF